jgi:hypothetical protein
MTKLQEDSMFGWLAVGAIGVGAGILLLRPRTASAAARSGSAVRSHLAREWAPLLGELGSDIPLAVALAWIDQESGGNVCAIGNKPPPGAKYPAEYGLSQLDSSDPENVAIMGRSDARAPCQNSGATRADWEVQLRPLTDTERTMHARGALDHMRSARAHARASTAGWGWDPNGVNTWKMAKLYHAGPAYVHLASIVAKGLGRAARDFAEYQALANIAGTHAGLTQKQLNRAWDNVAHFSTRLAALMGSQSTA